MKLILGSRGSKLALTQAKMIGAALQKAHPQLEIDWKIIKTQGDLILDRPLKELGGQGLFVKEIEEALLAGEIDLAVHSLKDLPAQLPAGLEIKITPLREDPRDVLVTFRGERSLSDLGSRPQIATGSPRRAVQLKRLWPEVEIKAIRGNVETRLRKSQEQNWQGVVLAAAGLNRLGQNYAGLILPPEQMLPAPGQGILGLETRQGESKILDLLQVLQHQDSYRQAQAERAFLAGIAGGCQTPMGAYCEILGDSFRLRGFYANEQGGYWADSISGSQGEEAELGRKLALNLKEQAGNG